MIEAIRGTECIFGEAPVWDASAGELYWIDCLAPGLLRHNLASGRTERLSVKLPCPTTGLVEAADNRLVVISSVGLFLIEPEKQRVSPLPLQSAWPLIGANDGKCDRQGRLWVGTGDKGGSRLPGHLLRIDPDLHAELVDTGFSIPNGPAFSTDGRRMYLADSAAGRIYCYPVEPSTGGLGVREFFAAIPASAGAPDGMTVDEADHLWVALYAGSALLRYTAQGVLERRISLPASRITSCAFGGPHYIWLFITSAVRDWPSDATQVGEDARRETLFRTIAPVRGVREQPFAITRSA